MNLSPYTISILSFIGFTLLAGVYAFFKTRKDDLQTQEGYFLGGRTLTGTVIAASMIMTNISTEHLVGMNGSSYKNGAIIIAWEVTSALALIVAAVYFVPKYLKMGLTTIPEYLENRFNPTTRTMMAGLLLISFAVTLLPIVLYTGAINLESIFSISELLGVEKSEGLVLTIIVMGLLGSLYAIFGGLKAVSVSDVIYGYGLLLGGLMIPLLALIQIGDGNPIRGISMVFESVPHKFNVIGQPNSVLPFSTLFTGLVINQLYFWCMNQTIVQRVLGAKDLKEAQKGLLVTGLAKILVPFIIVLPGIIGFYFFQETHFGNQDIIYPLLVQKVLPTSLLGFFAAVVMGAVLSTFNAVLNSASTIFSMDVYKRLIQPEATDARLVFMGKMTATILAISSVIAAPFMAKAPDGLFQLLQELNGIFFIPIASVILGGFFFKNISGTAANVALLTGFFFYILCTFIIQVDIHFVHLWGIEFLLNVGIMLAVSQWYPRQNIQMAQVDPQVDMTPWKYTKPFAFALVFITLTLYIALSQV
ncbi:MAG: solute:sodium symporter family transporter [Spirosomataceae bacterium]